MRRPFNQSIRQVGPAHWQIGSLICERVQKTPPADGIASWQDRDCRYVLRKPADVANDMPSFATSPDAPRLFYEMGRSTAVWEVGDQAFCKVKAWDPAMESEANTIAYVKKIAPMIKTPDVIYSWTEQDRSYLLIKRIEGSTLRDAWASLSASERDIIVNTIAHYCTVLARETSPTIGSCSGQPLYEPYLASDSELLAPRDHEQSTRYFSAPSIDCPDFKDFNFYHPDLGPGNIIVSQGSIAGVIDWEAAGYYPHFWIATKPAVSPGLDFCPTIAEVDDHEWRKRLKARLEALGFPQASGWFMDWLDTRP